MAEHDFCFDGCSPCTYCLATIEEVEDNIVPAECPGHIPEKGLVLSVGTKFRFIADGRGGVDYVPL